MRNLGITRDKNQLESLRQKAEMKNINIVPLPVTEIISLLNDETQIPNLTKYDWLFFSSTNGVHTFFKQAKDAIPKDVKIAVVGEKTADAIRSYNLEIDFQPSQAYGKLLFEEFSSEYQTQKLEILYVRAKK